MQVLKKILGYSKIGLVDIEDGVFIGAGSTILPNVRIGKNSIIGANTVVTKNIPQNVVVVGNPAKIICSVDEYTIKMKNLMNEKNTYDASWRLNNIDEIGKKEMITTLRDGIGFVE